MKYNFILLIFTLLLNTYKMEELCTTVSEVEKKHTIILEGNDLESLVEKGDKINLKNGEFFILKTLKTPIYITIKENTEERKKSISLLKKFTESYDKDEFKPFTYFIDCIEKDHGEIILLFGNFGDSFDNSSLVDRYKNLPLIKQLENGSKIFNFISRLENFNLLMKVDTDKILFKAVENELVPIAVLVDNIFEEKIPVVDLGKILSPEEKKNVLLIKNQ